MTLDHDSEDPITSLVKEDVKKTYLPPDFVIRIKGENTKRNL